jgi:Sensors of blue-light using FAD
MALCQLVYCSEKRDLGPGGIQAILDGSRVSNARDDITGVLLLNQDNFLQLLEGSRPKVTDLFCRIAADPRHANIMLIAVHDVQERDFPDWTMGYVPSTSPGLNTALREHFPPGQLTPETLTAESAVILMRLMGSAGRLV